MKTNIKVYFCLLLILASIEATAQKIDTDSLLVQAYKEFNEKNNSNQAKKLAWQAIAIAPDYLDFHVLLGRIHQRASDLDSASFYFNYVLERNKAYEEVYRYIIPIEISRQDFDKAKFWIDDAKSSGLPLGPLLGFEHQILIEQGDQRVEYDFLKNLLEQYPDQSTFRQRFNLLDSRFNSDRVGLTYSLTGFDRDGVGPWHLVGAQYIREREWGSLIGRVNYADRLSGGESITNGIQYELESYFFTGKMSYSYVGVAYSDAIVFPNWRLGYSYYKNFMNGWEGELGLRYTKVTPPEGDRIFRSGIIGIGKYVGSYWINLRTFIQNEESSFYPAFTLTTRYFFGGRFDYFTFIAGYGTSPDERTTLGQFENRVALDSYRAGAGYYKTLGRNVLFGLQFMYNYQEFAPGVTQSEFEGTLNLQYRF